MAAALKRIHLQEIVVLDDDTDTLVGLVGKRVVPILVKDDGRPMLESMDMVSYIDEIGDRIFVGPQRPEIAEWAERTAERASWLTWPRYPLLGLPEFTTIAALDHYTMRKRKTIGDFVELRAKTREYLRDLDSNLDELDGLIAGPQAINGKLSLDDVRVLPLLRSAAVVKGLRFPDKVRSYFETMMASIGYQPLPTA
jgi:glutaredoxin 2